MKKTCKDINQNINGNNNIQVAGDFIKTDKIIKTTQVIYDSNEYIYQTPKQKKSGIKCKK